MYGIGNMRISMMQDVYGGFPVVHERVTPAWFNAEHYQNCDSNLLGRIRSFFGRKAN